VGAPAYIIVKITDFQSWRCDGGVESRAKSDGRQRVTNATPQRESAVAAVQGLAAFKPSAGLGGDLVGLRQAGSCHPHPLPKTDAAAQEIEGEHP
jgi:hypothetical protein